MLDEKFVADDKKILSLLLKRTKKAHLIWKADYSKTAGGTRVWFARFKNGIIFNISSKRNANLEQQIELVAKLDDDALGLPIGQNKNDMPSQSLLNQLFDKINTLYPISHQASNQISQQTHGNDDFFGQD